VTSPNSNYELVADVQYGALNRQRLDIYCAATPAENAALILFFYGGGWDEGERSNYEFVASGLTGHGHNVVIADYRLFPEVQFPAFVEDAALSIDWISNQNRVCGQSTKRFFIMGHSAGAHIAALLALDKRYSDRLTWRIGQIEGLIGLSGPYDFLPLEDGYLVDVFPETQRDASQPIRFVSSAAPPTLLIHGTDDSTVDIGNSTLLADALRNAGVAVTLRKYDGVGHARTVATIAPPLDRFSDTLADVLDFIEGTRASHRESD
jgi:acetyl esterase/lipase